VLVIDDSLIAGHAMVRALRDAGLSADAIESPIGATAAILRNHARVVVIDMNMPSLQGDRLVGLLRGVERLADVKLVLASGDDSGTLERTASAAGAHAVFRKSSGHPALVDLARSLLE